MTRIALANFLLLIVLFACSKGSSPSSGGGQTTPSIKISDISLNRDVTNTTFRFYVDLNAATSGKVSVTYTTMDGTAKANKDYIPKTGTLTFDANQTNSYIDVTVVGDSLRQSDQTFYVQLS